ncbi:MAG TPA: phage portal protein [Phenylobacterium sp.]|nr:phage portal protein [Phenylobacterium sp.]
MAGLWHRLVAPLAMSAGFVPAARDIDDPRLWGGLNNVSVAGQVVTSETGLQHWAVQACLEALAGPISSLPLMVFERLDGDRRRPAREHPLFELLQDGVGRQTAQEFRDDKMRILAWWRNYYALIVPAEDGGPVGHLEPIHPSRMLKVERGTDGWVYYFVRRLPPAVGQDVYREDMIHHVRKAPLTPDGLRGQPMWETARETLGRAQAVEAFGALFFANGSHGGGILKHPGAFRDKDEERAFLDTWRNSGSGANRFRDRLLKNGVDYQAPEVTNEDSQFLESKKQAGYEVAALWNMPPHRVGMLERATNNNVEQQSLEYVMYALGPWISADEQALRRDLLVGDELDRYFIEYNVAGLLRGDLKTRWAAYAQGRQWGWLSINDVRRLENMDPIGPEGDVHSTPLNMVPAGYDPNKPDPQEQTDNAA